MTRLSRIQERDERRKMGKGMTTSVVALILCWAPVLGVLLAAVGHISVMRCITMKYKKRFIAYAVLTALILVLCVGVLTVEVYAYSRNPNIVSDTGAWLLETITGQPVNGGYLEEDYTGDNGFGMGMNDDLFSQGYYDADGNFVYDSQDGMEGDFSDPTSEYPEGDEADFGADFDEYSGDPMEEDFEDGSQPDFPQEAGG